MTGQSDRARLQTLTDAIVAATQALPQIGQHEEIVNVHFGEFADGGWYWSITVASRREMGNTKTALIPAPRDYRSANARQVVLASMDAQQAEQAGR